MTFKELNLNENMLEALSYMNFETATPIQEKAIPIILENKDLIACAQTGTGKTAAFVLPILNKITGKEDTTIDTLIIVPTRELAIQIEQQIQGLSYFVSVGSKAIYGGGGGKEWAEEKEALTVGTDIIVATPGKLLSHLKLGYVKFDSVKHLVLDEADRMLDMGFIDDLKSIISKLPKDRQTLMFSATMPNNIRQLAKSIQKNPLEVSLSISKPAAGVTQRAILTFDEQKDKVLCKLIREREEYTSILIFTSAKAKVSSITRSLNRAKLPAKGISSNLEQSEREEVLRGFRSKRIRILVATDVMSRGIDIKEINMVINYDAPSDAEDYVHRIGRTARANTKGEAVTLINQKDMPKIRRIERLIESEIPKEQPAEEFGPGPEWKVGSSNSGNRNRNRKGKKRYYGKKKPGGQKGKSGGKPSGGKKS
ncbi:MAG: DEAD/DEAH box helicase [bacterium]|nr:DEAD/DEAH box helicase [bacterium]